MDELIDILDAEGNFTGKKQLKSYAHCMGFFHSTVHIWFYTTNRELLIQQRAKNKDTHPLLWDVSVAGHVSAGEAIEVSAIREVAEEIGLAIQTDQLVKIGIFKSVQKHREDLIDREFHHTFLCELKVPIAQLKKQESEVEDLALIPIHRFEKEVFAHSLKDKYVPHDRFYYESVLEAIKKL